MPVDVRIRAPIATAWAVTLGAIVICGELYYELQRSKIATFIGRPFTDNELWPAVICLGVAALVSLAWLLSLYLRPGRLQVDPDADRMVRQVRPYLRTRVIEGTLADWRARVLFFSSVDRDRGAFKRIELSTTDWQEVILFADLARGEELARALLDLDGRLEALEVEITHPTA